VGQNEIVVRQSTWKSLVLLSRLLFNTSLEHFFFIFWSPDEMLAEISVAASASQFDLHSSADLLLLSIDALDDLLSSDSIQVVSEDALLVHLPHWEEPCRLQIAI
jgi:hypothetical protein